MTRTAIFFGLGAGLIFFAGELVGRFVLSALPEHWEGEA